MSSFLPLCVTCMYNRPSVSSLFLDGMDRLNVGVLAAVSDRSSMDVCEGRAESFLYFNDPLGKKWNAVIEKSLDLVGWTHLIISGDDDLYDDDYIKRCEEFQDHPFVGLGSLYMVDPKERSALHFKYVYETPVAIGSGKMLQRQVVEKAVKAGGVFDSELKRGLDYGADMRLFELGYTPFLIDNDRTLMLDIKARQNVWPLSNFKDLAPRVSWYEAVNFLTDEERLKLLRIGTEY